VKTIKHYKLLFN